MVVAVESTMEEVSKMGALPHTASRISHNQCRSSEWAAMCHPAACNI